MIPTAIRDCAIGYDIALSSFAVTFPRPKPWGFETHREQLAAFQLYCSGPFYPPCVQDGLVKGLKQWSESFAALVARN